MKILNSNFKDLDTIFSFYKTASEYQRSKKTPHWPEFDRAQVTTEIQQKRQWKMIVDGRIACIWAITFSDPLIWEEKNKDPAIYIHRIATHPDFRGMNLVLKIVEWAKEYSAKHKKKYIRMDTVGNNIKLIAHYKKNGFTFLGIFKLKNTEGLYGHYHNAEVSLFEIKTE